MRRSSSNKLSLTTLVASCAALMLLASAGGCGGGGMGAEVSGRVTLDGKPVGPGTIVFAPPEKGANPATGTIQIDGTYVLMSNRLPGLPAGRYRASVMVFDQPPTAPGERSTVAPKLVTPQKYADPATSGLEYDVAAGSQTIDVPLVSGP